MDDAYRSINALSTSRNTFSLSRANRKKGVHSNIADLLPSQRVLFRSSIALLATTELQRAGDRDVLKIATLHDVAIYL